MKPAAPARFFVRALLHCSLIPETHSETGNANADRQPRRRPAQPSIDRREPSRHRAAFSFIPSQRSPRISVFAVAAPSLVTDGAYRPNLGPLNGAAPFFVREFVEGDGGTARLVQVLEENS